jgi:acyl carrier protein
MIRDVAEEEIPEGFFNVLARRLRYVRPGQRIDPESSLRDLGLDSMRSVELLLDIEEAFDVTLPDELLVEQTFATARSLWLAVAPLRRA